MSPRLRTALETAALFAGCAVLGERGPAHQWLFHLLIAPLTALGGDLRALHIASAVAAATPAARWLRERTVSLRPVTAVAVGVFAGATRGLRRNAAPSVSNNMSVRTSVPSRSTQSGIDEGLRRAPARRQETRASAAPPARR